MKHLKRFNTEALAAASLSHANIVSIYDVGNEDNIYYIVMELVRGKTLKQIITENGTFRGNGNKYSNSNSISFRGSFTKII